MSIGSFDNPDMADADRINREVTDEALEIIKLAFENESFSYKGKYFELPPAGIPDRGGFVETLTLIPRPKYPYEIWQAITIATDARAHADLGSRRRVLEPEPQVHQAVLRSVR